MNTLITPAQAVALAFADGEYLAPESVTQSDIAAAEQRYLVPVIGRLLYEKLLSGSHAGFTTEYLAAPGSAAPSRPNPPPTSPQARRPCASCNGACAVRPGRCCAAPPNTSKRTPPNFRNTTRTRTSSTAVRPMETLYRLVSGAAAGIAALFAPIGPLVACAVVFIGIDFLSGVAASRAAARREGRAWYFESREAWRTVLKLALAITAIAMAWLIDSCILDFMELNVARLFTGFTCGVELWSFLENASQLSDAPLFRWLRRYVRRRIRRETGDE